MIVCCACQVFAVAMCMKLMSLFRAIRLRREEINFEQVYRPHSNDKQTLNNCWIKQDRDWDVPEKLLKHRKNLERTARMIQGTHASHVIIFVVHVHAHRDLCNDDG